MNDASPIQGELQSQVMAAVWRLESATVEQVRQALPGRYRGAYTTVQTVLNRLADRGMLERERDGRNIVYRPTFTEAEYLSRSIEHTLASASSEARHAALARLIGGLREDELGEVQKLAGQAGKARRRRAS